MDIPKNQRDTPIFKEQVHGNDPETDRWMGKKVLVFSLVLVGFVLSSSARARSNFFKKDSKRIVELTEIVRVRVPEGSERVKIWIPRPANHPYQSAELLDVRTPFPPRMTQDPDFGNPLLYFEVSDPEPGLMEFRMLYRVARKEQAGPLGEKIEVSALHREPRGLVAVNDEIRRLAAKATEGVSDPMAKARALYHYVLSRMDYDKSGVGWGRGDSLYACRIGKGNCTDFHSLFMAMALAEGIPARFCMGYALPRDPQGSVGKGYHCWAEFYARGKGWIPVDISEAWKNPARVDYYFGTLDKDRVLVSVGRDLRLSPLQEGGPLNYLVHPYVEVNGKPYDAFELERNYKDLEKGETRT